MNNNTAQRKDFIKKLFPNDLPLLWCPPLTHHDSTGNTFPDAMINEVEKILTNLGSR